MNVPLFDNYLVHAHKPKFGLVVCLFVLFCFVLFSDDVANFFPALSIPLSWLFYSGHLESALHYPQQQCLLSNII